MMGGYSKISLRKFKHKFEQYKNYSLNASKQPEEIVSPIYYDLSFTEVFVDIFDPAVICLISSKGDCILRIGCIDEIYISENSTKENAEFLIDIKSPQRKIKLIIACSGTKENECNQEDENID